MGGSATWVGRVIGGGRYEVVVEIGDGSMGHVYRARARHLGTDVVVKSPARGDATSDAEEALERFRRETASLVRLSHPHIIKVVDVGEEPEAPFVVMQYLSGGSLRDRLDAGPMRPEALHPWLLDLAGALDFVHDQGHIHRDVKPANVLFDGQGNAYLGDFGIVKALPSDDPAANPSDLTAPGFLMGTPNYIAPEVVMGLAGDGRVDQYALAMIVHEAIAGRNLMQGPTASATIVNQTKVVPAALRDLIAGVPRRLSDAVARALSKDPDSRFEDCLSFAREALAEVLIEGPSGRYAIPGVGATSRGEVGRVPCPGCRAPLPVAREDAGKRLQCPACQAHSLVQYVADDLRLTRVGPPTPARTLPPESRRPDPSLATGSERVFEAASPMKAPARRPRLIIAAGAALLIAVAALIRFGYLGGAGDAGSRPPWRNPDVITINIAYGSEKKKWFEESAREFRKTGAGKYIQVNLIPQGSLEGMQAILNGAKPTPIHVWSPASGVTRDLFERRWKAKHPNNPILRHESLALTPMAFVMWKSRHDPFVRKYGRVDFRTLSEAMQERGGWGAIAAKPEWGAFKFGHTDPFSSNSGLVALVLMAYERSNKQRGLRREDVSRPEFRGMLMAYEGLISRSGGSLTNSTGNLMAEMVSRGPGSYDGLFVYENLAIDYLQARRKTYGEVHVSYPTPNLWNENPYYILDVPWSGEDHHRAAREFLEFLLSEPVQMDALRYGFRPADSTISLDAPDSPFVKFREAGLAIDIPAICELPKADVVTELLEEYRRIEP